MDNRLPQPSTQPFAATHSAASQPSSTSHTPQHSQTAQPPVQIPFSDPFHTRDPFMPSSAQHSRRDSYSIAPATPAMGAPYERAWSTQPQPPAHTQHPQTAQHHQLSQASHTNPPQSSSSSASASAPTTTHMSSGPFPYDSARRRSVGSERYPGGMCPPLDPRPPPPLSYSSRNMPPPSPTSGPSSSAFSMPAPRHTPSASPYVGSRELPPFNSRPGATMSISSLIGGDSSRHGNHSPKTVATAPSPPMKPIHPSSPQRARSASTRAPNGHFPRPHSPTSILQAQRQSDSMSQPFNQSGPHQPPHMSQHNAAPGFRPFQSSPPSAQHEEHQPYPGHAPSRPNSQPMHAHLDQELRNRQDMHDRPPPRHPSAFPPYVDHMGRPGPSSQPPSRPDPDRQELNGNGHHQGPHTMSHTARSTPAPPPPPQSYGRLNFGSAREDYPGLFRPAVQAPSREEMEQRGPHNERPDYRYTPAMNGMDDRQRPNAAHYAMYGPPGYEAREGDEHPLQRAFLGVASEMRHKNGRASPLPQAVHGAQPRHTGPGADPGVKSEFGRMFSGLGSGVGSNTPTAGIATPSRGSPARQADANDETDSRKARSRLREDTREDSDSVDGRNTPTASQRGSKRPKTTHAQPHHHHHHAHAHHHHHHHHGLPEEQMAHASAPFHPLRYPSNASTPQQPGSAAPPPPHHHHHHHHHAVHAHAPHHHHHNVRPPPMPSARKPQTTISNQELLASVSTLPRKHLGSQVYSTKLSLPPRESTPLDFKYHFKSSVKPIPRFEDKANCTFTVRVPRAYLGASSAAEEDSSTIAGGLEEICKTRAVWGSDVYSDDSDPIAAAVHSGWIRGDFGEYNEDLRELFKEGQEDASETPDLNKVYTEKPARPLRAPQKADLHITLLILPALAYYTASTQNFLRSRDWGSDHDGVSYMIHSIEFVEESSTNRFVERSAAAKHQRIKDDLARRKEAAESLLGLLQGPRRNMTPASSNVSVGA
ncbi:Rxt3-domain-containing protein, partial [Aureobasidium melanogenum]